MSTPSCHRMPPCWDDLRQARAILGQFALQSILQIPQVRKRPCRRSAARSIPDLTAGLRLRLTAVPPLCGCSECSRITAISGRIAPQSGIIRHRFAKDPSVTQTGEMAAKSGTRSRRLAANSHVPNILPGMQLTIRRREPISGLISTAYVFAAPVSSELTPYLAIFCKLILANQLLAGSARKIFKTNDFNRNILNILQIIVCNILKTGILIFLLFSEVNCHGCQDL